MKQKEKRLVVDMTERLMEDLARSVHARSCKEWYECPQQCGCIKKLKSRRPLNLDTAMIWHLSESIQDASMYHTKRELMRHIKELMRHIQECRDIALSFERVLGLHFDDNKRAMKVIQRSKMWLDRLLTVIDCQHPFYIEEIEQALKSKQSIV